jgi:hypothetical protein
MQGRNSQLDGSQELVAIQRRDFTSGNLFARIIDAVNGLAQNIGAVAVGKLDPPPPIDTIQVQGTQVGNVLTCPSEILHWTMTHNQVINKGIRYFSEISTSNSFNPSNTHVVDHGTSRTGFLSLPTFLSDGATKQTYYLRSYAQYPGSDPQKPTVLGGLGAATQIQMTGSSAATLLNSTGSGTGTETGTRGQGLGVVLTRPAPTTKRSLL